MLVLGLDFETTGFEPETHRVTEVGAVLWDTDRGIPLQLQSELVYDGSYTELEPIITEITGIDIPMLEKWAVRPEQAFSVTNYLIEQAEAVVAHNGAQFDSDFYAAEMSRLNIPTIERTWIDTGLDLPFPPLVKTRKLVHLCAEHGFLNPFAHRAVFDVLSMLTLFQKYDAKAALELASQPWVKMQALVSFDEKDLAKERGYYWAPAPKKQWLKAVRLSQVDKEKQEAPFKVLVMEQSKRQFNFKD